ncbi:MAG: hypothetical protein KDD21_00680 [Bacteroidetes bacterium]|nr:hypothetical protein [Bacteroidota bacterium]
MAKKQPHQPNTVRKQSERKASINKQSSSFQPSNKILIPIILLMFVALAYIYCKPLLNGMQLSTHDSNQYIAMNKEVADFKAANGYTPLWSSRMFGGMPSFIIGGLEFHPAIQTPMLLIHKVLRVIPDPAMEIIFLLLGAFIGFYVLLRRTLYAVIGAIAVGFCTANFVSLDAGHITKVITISMFLPLLASVWLLFDKKYILGTILLLIYAFEIIAGAHIQIAYYSLMLVGLYVLVEFIRYIKQKEIKHAFISSSIFVLCFAVAGMMNFNNYFLNDFSKETTRGGDILNQAKMQASTNPTTSKESTAPTKHEKGVGFDYATQWSFGYEELGSLFVPNFVGGSASGSLDENSHVYKALSDKGASPQQASQFSQQMPLYWGTEPFVQGPIYLGAIIVFLFFFGCFAYKGNLKPWLIGSIVLTILIALGKNLEFFYRLLYDFVPAFNKFRAPTMILALTQILMVTLGLLGLRDFFDETITSKEEKFKALKISSGIVGGLLLFFIVLGSIFSFQTKADEKGNSTDIQFKAQLTQMQNEQFANDIYSALKQDRNALMRADAIRSFILIAIVAVLLYLSLNKKIKNNSVVLTSIAVLVLIDFWMINKRYLNDNDFEEKSMVAMNTFPETPADAAILAQNKDNARMADFTVDVFNSANPAYYHRTIGGYNPAKLRRYQDVIEHGLSYDFQQINKVGFSKANFINMLNTKYLKQSTEANGVAVNNFALGNAWFVNSIQLVNSPEEEILNVRSINPARTAVVNAEFKNYVNGFVLNTDTSAFNETRFIKKIETNNPDKLEYSFKSPKDEFVVFSEVIYRPNEDWHSYIDGQPADHIRVNYILRGMKVKHGEHKITFEFKPKLYATTNSVILTGNILFNVIILGLLGWYFYQRKRKQTPTDVAAE